MGKRRFLVEEKNKNGRTNGFSVGFMLHNGISGRIYLFLVAFFILCPYFRLFFSQSRAGIEYLECFICFLDISVRISITVGFFGLVKFIFQDILTFSELSQAVFCPFTIPGRSFRPACDPLGQVLSVSKLGE